MNECMAYVYGHVQINLLSYAFHYINMYGHAVCYKFNNYIGRSSVAVCLFPACDYHHVCTMIMCTCTCRLRIDYVRTHAPRRLGNTIDEVL